MNKDELDKMFEQLNKDVDPKALVKKIEEENDKYNQELRARAKTPEQLTVGLECVVQEVHCYQSSTSVSGAWRSGSIPSYPTSHTYRTEIKVKSSTLVEKLEFKGWPHLEIGDVIKAYILKGKQEAEKSFGSSRHDPFHQGPKTHLVERDYQPIEHPSKIEKLRDGKVVATYHNR